MDSVTDIFKAFGGTKSVGEAIGVPTEHAGAIKHRRSIPSRYWAALVTAARERGVNGITLEALAEMHAKPKRRAG